MTNTPKKRLPGERAYAWKIPGDCLCCWAEPTRHDLIRHVSPTDDAKIVVVRIIEEKELRELVRKAGGLSNGQ